MRPTCPAHLILLDLIILIKIFNPQLRNFGNSYAVLSKNSKNRIYIRNWCGILLPINRYSDDEFEANVSTWARELLPDVEGHNYVRIA
jgi:hypothetical protein